MTAADFQRLYVRRGRPVLIRGLVGDWDAVREWTPGYLADCAMLWGDVEVRYRSTPDQMPRVDLARIDQGPRSLVDLLRECEASPDAGRELYVPGLDITGGDLKEDLGVPDLLSGVGVDATTAFFGRNTRCLGHYHPQGQALLCQAQGIKRIWMYPPSELRRLSLFPTWSEGFFRSQINFYGDRSAFPDLARARGQLFELHPGDALFIPLHWLHVPEGLGWSVSVTYWWRPRLAEWPLTASTLRALVGLGFKALRSRRRAESSPPPTG